MESKRILVKNFWPPYFETMSRELTEDDLGWNEDNRFDAHSDDTKFIFDLFIDHLGWDLSFYFTEDDTFYYVEVMEKSIYKRKGDPKWDGKYIYERCDIYALQYYDRDDDDAIIFDFDNVQEVWDKFTLNGHDMKYIIEHSVCWLAH